MLRLALGRAGRVAVRRTVARALAAALALAVADIPTLAAQEPGLIRHDAGRFSILADARDEPLARALLASAAERDTFPGLARPRQAVIVMIAPDADRFRAWAGALAPEWGAAVAFPARRLVVMQGRAANTSAGDPVTVLRHELAHLALHEALGDRAPRWFDEGYASFAAGEWGRDEYLATSLALVVRRGRSLEAVDSGFAAGAISAEASYALAYRAVAEMAALDPERGLALLFRYWGETPRLDAAMRRAYGITLDGFERRWQQRTRLRYGALALAADLTIATLVFLALLGPLWWMRRRRDRQRLAAMRAADALAEARERESAIAALLREVGGRSELPPS
ncbi:MAG: hypothetical protein HY275_14105 [Gemmatimonadetes bacterium]|nr:hypothetical protein [Gemmatimonadota bacterium]